MTRFGSADPLSHQNFYLSYTTFSLPKRGFINTTQHTSCVDTDDFFFADHEVLQDFRGRNLVKETEAEKPCSWPALWSLLK
jgi:hypothetical protein